MLKIGNIRLPEGTLIPNHIAVVPDGNRRWARSRGLHTLNGHKKGAQTAVELGRASRKLGVHTLTFWGLSTENWNRSPKEIAYLVDLYGWLINEYLADAVKEGVKIIHLGRKDRLPKQLLTKIAHAEKVTSDNKEHILNIALDYGGHDEIIRATKTMIEDGVKAEDVDKALFEKYLDTKDQPYPYVDLIIRSSGEQRTSGFLLWQTEYAELYWECDHFPDFTPKKLGEAILDYSRRRRRFGANDEIEHFNFKPELVAKLEIAWWRLGKIPQGTSFLQYSANHIKEQYGFSKQLALKAAKSFTKAVTQKGGKDWTGVKSSLKEFYTLVKEELALAFEPEVVASFEVKLWREMGDKQSLLRASEAEDTATHLYAEVYRISLLQAARLAHLRVMAKLERNMAEAGMGEKHWVNAEDYLFKFYAALKDRVA